jgi:very-short-patch-repair endonuclease/predicted transcriptional regulator of viral defense system
MPNERREMHDMRAELVVRSHDAAIAALAARQHGIVARRQLAAIGLGRGAIAHRVAAGRLHRLHRGVYAVGHPILTANGHRMAAVLSCGSGAVLTYASAAALWEIRPTQATKIDVSVRGRGGRATRPRVRVHRAATLRDDEITIHQAIRVTTPARTLLDLASSLPRRALERALDQAEVMELFDLCALQRMVERHRGERGSAALSTALADHSAGTTLTKSELEERMLALCDRHALPRPRVNAWVENLEVDFLFAAEKLVVEADSYRYHRSRRAFERDRERDAILARAGYQTLRFTHRQMSREPATVAHTIRSSA